MKILLFGLRRSGTTLAFNLFRQCEALRCYYEPLHPNLVSASGSSCIESDRKGAFSEFRLIYSELEKKHAGFGAPKYDVTEELIQNNLTPRHLEYLDFLFGSHENVLLQPVRLNYQLYQLRARYPDARFVWVLRRPEGFIKSVLAYRPSMLNYRDAGLPSNRAIANCKKNVVFRLMRGWRAFDNPWSQVAAANFIVNSRPFFRELATSPTWLKLLALWYDHYLFVSNFIRANSEVCQVFLYDEACKSNTYTKDKIGKLGLDFEENAFDGLIDSRILHKQDQARIEIAEGEASIRKMITDFGIDLDLSFQGTVA